MFKKIFLSIAFVLTAVALGAQSLSVESFKLLETDLTANTAGTMKRDQNGDVAALIKVVTSETGFSFDNGMLGIVASEQKTGEVWVYVPFGTGKLTIAHQQLGVLRDWSIPIPVEKGRTYELRLVSGKVRTIVEDQVSAQFVTIMVEPKTASVRIDDNLYQLDLEGSVSQLLSYGSHSYHVEAPGYSPEDGIIQVDSEKKTISVALKSSKGTVTIECPMSDAEIYLNNELVGHGSWTGQLDPAMYQVETRLAGHRSRVTSFTLEARGTKTVSAPAPQPIYGTLSITSTPGRATVLLDGKEVGETPLLQGDILIGDHEIELIRQDYSPYKTTVTVKEGQMESVSVKLSDVFQAVFKSNPSGASLTIDGQAQGITPFQKEMSSGDHDIRLSKQGYETYHKTMHIDAIHPEISIDMPKRLLTRNQLQLSALYGLGGDIDFSAGIYLHDLNMEIGYYSPNKDKVTIYWVTDPATEASSTRYVECQYQCKSKLSAVLGYGIRLNNMFRITPQAGVSNLVIQSEDQETGVLSAMAGLKLEYSPLRHIALVARPSYLKPVRMGPIAEQLDKYTSLVCDWCSGFAAEIGVELYF
ncbi:MAG: PEGA domain-containing protein [Bacteroidetes bacterium]|nr:PEGA domain-containing protein [Candidatus Colenecus caballi]